MNNESPDHTIGISQPPDHMQPSDMASTQYDSAPAILRLPPEIRLMIYHNLFEQLAWENLRRKWHPIEPIALFGVCRVIRAEKMDEYGRWLDTGVFIRHFERTIGMSVNARYVLMQAKAWECVECLEFRTFKRDMEDVLPAVASLCLIDSGDT